MEETSSRIPAFLRQPVTIDTFRRRKPKIHEVRMRLTPAGWGFCGLIIVEFLLSINFSSNLVFAMTFLLVGIVLIGLYHSRANLTGLRVSDWRTSPVFAGQQAEFRLRVDNKSSRMRHGLQANARAAATGDEYDLASGSQAEITLRLQTVSRGLLAASDSWLCSRFPLGLFETRLFTGKLPQSLVYPSPTGNQPLPDSVSGRQAHLRAEAGSYTDMRRYSPGDPLSRISWKAFARFDELYTKEFDGAAGQPALWLCWEDVIAGGTEEKLSQLCRWVLDAHKKNREYGLKLPGIKREPGSEDTHLHECLEVLALYGKSGWTGGEL